MLTQVARTFDSVWFRLPVRRQLTILITLPLLGLAIALLSLEHLRQDTLDESDVTSKPSLLEHRWTSTAIAAGIPTGISLISLGVAIYWVRHLQGALSERDTQLAAATALQQAIESSLVDGLIVLNASGQIEAVNDAMTRIFGYEPVELIGHPLKTLFTNSEAPASMRLLEQSGPITNGTTYQKATGRPQVGPPFPIELWIRDLPPIQKRLVLIRDISAVTQLEAELRSHQDALSQTTADLTRARADLCEFHLACHDLRSPMQAIAHLSTWIEADLDDRVKGHTQEQIHLLRQRVQRMEQVVNGVLQSHPSDRG